ncbi:hypothetical protein VNO77_04454 [Canavalia gladiata]|uniref:Uncharacterized protein n=1 Tax=Canavalia gladiata TaxID=3824 RepID=A0AAN9RD75_CANGL
MRRRRTKTEFPTPLRNQEECPASSVNQRGNNFLNWAMLSRCAIGPCYILELGHNGCPLNWVILNQIGPCLLSR